MRSRTTSVLAALSVISFAAATAQVQPGDIAMVSLVDYQFCVFDGAGIPTHYVLSNLTGTGAIANTNAIVWDPSNPQSFILGGEGFIGRVTITSPGVSSYSLITNAIGSISQLSFDANGKLIAIDSMSSEVLRVDPANGQITQLTFGPHPWGADLNAGAIDPATGDIFVGANQSLYRIANGATTGTLLSSNWSSGQYAFCTGITFDPNSSDLFVSILTADRIVRMDRNTGAVTDVCPPKSIQSCNSIAVDQNGDLVVGGWQNNLYRVPSAGGAPTLIGQAQNQGLLATAVDVVLESCAGTVEQYGTGCPGAGGIVPSLDLEGCPTAGSNVTLTIDQGLGGSTAILLFGLFPSQVPISPGCSLWVFPVLGPQLTLPLGGFGPGAGSIAVPGTIPPATSAVTFAMQAFIIDSTMPLGASATNGVQVTIP